MVDGMGLFSGRRRAWVFCAVWPALALASGCSDSEVGGRQSPAAQQNASPQASVPLSRFALAIEIHSASVLDDMVIVARLSDREIGRTPAPQAPAAWADRIQLSHQTSEFVPIFERSMTEDGRALLVVRPILSGSRVKASITDDGVTLESNVAVVPETTDDGMETLVARGRIDELLKRWSDLDKVASDAIAHDDASPWGYYFRGTVERARHNPEAANAAFQRARERVKPGEEQPVGLLEQGR